MAEAKGGRVRGAEARPDDDIYDMDVSEEMSNSFLEYAMSVIVARALPDVRDGLKPVHRRILYTMFTSGMRPDGPYKKSARTVGSVIGKYHPHGDSAVYEAMVRMAQAWSMRLPLIDGHGNFGSLDDGPAAMRYTEARLAPSALLMLEELSEDTVDFVPNYDGTESEPSSLPAMIPNLLVNGSTGIAVGMATNMPPHRLSEVVGLLLILLERPSASDDELMAALPGPDFPSGGTVVLGDGYRSAFLTGQGQVALRAKAEIVDSGRRRSIVFTELPYTVGPEKVISRIKEMSASKRLNGVADVKDFSDRRTGLRLVVECRSGFAPEVLLEDLYRLTPLEENFSINNVALVDGTPEVLGVRAIAGHFLAHRRQVVRRRSQFRLERSRARAHVVEGLMVALSALDEVIAIVRAAKDSEAARSKLSSDLGLSEVQAQAVLDMTVRRLTALERGRLEKEGRGLAREIAALEKLLSSERKLSAEVARELSEISSRFGDERRSLLVSSVERRSGGRSEADGGDVPDDDCVVLLSPSGELTRDPADPSGAALFCIETSLRSPVGVVFEDGTVVRLPASDVISGAGSQASALRPSSKGRVVGLCDLRDGARTVMMTSSGLVKAVLGSAFPSRGDVRPVIRLDGSDRLVGACSDLGDGSGSHLVAISSAGRVLRFPSAAVSAKGLSAGGMAGVKLADGDSVIGFGVVQAAAPETFAVGMVSDAGRVKLLQMADVPAKGRGTGGVLGLPFRKGETRLTSAQVGEGLVPLSARGSQVRASVQASGRSASSVPPSRPVASFAPAAVETAR